ncbi:DNA adenine methylase [Iningainema tapete]|uniref:DNA adenine methylase n=1 Tax=Iningainema tapete TaxID=2806730 RepID=UPI00192D423D
MAKIPHPIPYQGSKRNLAAQIAKYIKQPVDTLYEPFAGSAAMTLYVADHKLARHFVIGDSLSSLIELWRLIVEKPEIVSNYYEKIWCGQHDGDNEYFYKIREKYNDTNDPIMLLYLIARCVKNSVRFNKQGNFTQSVDKRRQGMHPDKMRANVFGASFLLRGRVEFFYGDFSECIQNANQNSLIYLDPPYQGTTYGRDKRYFAQLSIDRLCETLYILNNKKIPFILSYDGMSGEKTYGVELPKDLNMSKVLLNAGRSSQATLNGENSITFESLYISHYVEKMLRTLARYRDMPMKKQLLQFPQPTAYDHLFLNY